MIDKRIAALCLPPLLFGTQPAWAEANSRPAILKDLVDCRTIADIPERVACYDARVAALDEAERSKTVVVIDKTQMRAARKGIFGLTLPSLSKIVGGEPDDGDEEAVTQIESKIERISRTSDGRWIFIIEDEAKWVQTDRRNLIRDPKSGQKISIRKAAMGSYLANVDGQTAIRVRREN